MDLNQLDLSFETVALKTVVQKEIYPVVKTALYTGRGLDWNILVLL